MTAAASLPASSPLSRASCSTADRCSSEAPVPALDRLHEIELAQLGCAQGQTVPSIHLLRESNFARILMHSCSMEVTTEVATTIPDFLCS